MDKIMETLDNVGINLFVLAALKELFVGIFRHSLCLFVYSVQCPSQCIYILCLVNISYERTVKWEICQIFKEDRLLVSI